MKRAPTEKKMWKATKEITITRRILTAEDKTKTESKD